MRPEFLTSKEEGKQIFFVKTILLAFTACLFVLESSAQQPLLSPRDSVEISFNGKKITVNYGRPSMRGRIIMGGLVPYDKVWRTGANEATSFVTEADLVMEGVHIPRGSYTLYTLPSARQWKLIINTQTGQWGTVYNQDRDLARIPMKKRTLSKPVEKFTITLERTGNASGILRLAWEKYALWVNFHVKKDQSSVKKNSR
jgi:hypothetical protein